jgi:hypothetical protein
MAYLGYIPTTCVVRLDLMPVLNIYYAGRIFQVIITRKQRQLVNKDGWKMIYRNLGTVD